MDQAEDKTKFKEWLEKLQQESWQLELLISGFAIFGIYAARTLIKDLEVFSDNNIFGDISFITGILIFVFKKGWLIFFLNLIIHVILRGLWIGAIGLRYVSREIEYDSFGYSEIFSQFLKNKVGSYDDFIERLEKMCSVLFAYTFLLFLLFVSFMLFIMQSLLILTFGIKISGGGYQETAYFSLFAFIYFGIGGIVFVDLITLGGFKKIKEKSVSKLYFYIYRFYGFMTLSFLYRPLLYNFIDDKYTRRLFYLSIPYIFIVISGNTFFENSPNPFLPENDILFRNGKLIDNYYYDDLRMSLLQEFPNEERKVNKHNLGWVSMEQFEITKPVSSIFIKTDNNFIKLLEKNSSLVPYKKRGLYFSWFNLNVVQDENIKNLERLKSVALTGLYEKKRKIIKSLKVTSDQNLIHTRDSITEIISVKEKFWKNKIQEEERSKMERSLQAYLSNVCMWIDKQPVLLDNCYFYRHPHFDEEGIKCFFVTDTLITGIHRVKMVRNIIDKRDSIRSDSIILPIVISGDKGK